METHNSISSREEKRMILIKDRSSLSEDAETYLKENRIPYDILWQESKYSFEYAQELLKYLEECDDDDEEELFTECLLSPFTEQGFRVLLCKSLYYNVN